MPESTTTPDVPDDTAPPDVAQSIAPPDVPESVVALAASLGDVPAYVYDLPGLGRHAASVRAAMRGTQIHYAVKANPDPEILRALAPHVDGFEVSSGGEFAHVRALMPHAPLSFGGPGKTTAELALAPGAYRWHVESPAELRRLTGPADVLLRVNLDVPVAGAALAMGGGATPFGMDPDGVDACLTMLRGPSEVVPQTAPVRLRGIHAHLASGLDAPGLLALAEAVLAYGRRLGVTEMNLGGGMAVSYRHPSSRFDWVAYGEGLRALARPGETLRVEPGRALTAYCGWYLTTVLDVKRVHGERFAILSGGTHHLRTPVTKGHDQPFVLLSRDASGAFTVSRMTGAQKPGLREAAGEEPVTLVGRLCTPKDVFARRVPASPAPGDVVAFAMAGAYAWNISHHDFLMHPKPSFHYL
ncbi:type III PLP-dependent enzyme [Microbispora sp. NPDC049125]|uniref:type III PLP-dependent enzyme n=1 Tax=Microbispora sp. NPDC049125 TaxID=3154929 RepID=UPI003467CA16